MVAGRFCDASTKVWGWSSCSFKSSENWSARAGCHPCKHVSSIGRVVNEKCKVLQDNKTKKIYIFYHPAESLLALQNKLLLRNFKWRYPWNLTKILWDIIIVNSTTIHLSISKAISKQNSTTCKGKMVVKYDCHSRFQTVTTHANVIIHFVSLFELFAVMVNFMW